MYAISSIICCLLLDVESKAAGGLLHHMLSDVSCLLLDARLQAAEASSKVVVFIIGCRMSN